MGGFGDIVRKIKYLIALLLAIATVVGCGEISDIASRDIRTIHEEGRVDTHITVVPVPTTVPTFVGQPQDHIVVHRSLVTFSPESNGLPEKRNISNPPPRGEWRVCQAGSAIATSTEETSEAWHMTVAEYVRYARLDQMQPGQRAHVGWGGFATEDMNQGIATEWHFRQLEFFVLERFTVQTDQFTQWDRNRIFSQELVWVENTPFLEFLSVYCVPATPDREWSSDDRAYWQGESYVWDPHDGYQIRLGLERPHYTVIYRVHEDDGTFTWRCGTQPTTSSAPKPYPVIRNN